MIGEGIAFFLMGAAIGWLWRRVQRLEREGRERRRELGLLAMHHHTAPVEGYVTTTSVPFFPPRVAEKTRPA